MIPRFARFFSPDPDGGVPLGTAPTPTPTEPEPASGRYIKCDCCGCKLTTSHGEIVRMGDQAKTWRDQDATFAKDRERFETTIAELREELRTVREELGTKKKGWLG